MRVLLTGSNGFIARHVINTFLSEGAKITGTDIHSGSRNPDIQYVQADLTKEASVKRLAENEQYDCIVHLAAILGMYDPATLIINPVCTYNALKIATLTKCNCFIHLSSIPIIGLPPENGSITEDTPARPQTLYHISKYAAEQITNFEDFRRIKTYNLRIASPIGPGMPNSYLKRMLTSARSGQSLTVFGAGSRVQNYIDARDIAAAMASLVKSMPDEGLYLLAGESCSNLSGARMCVEISQNNSPIVYSGTEDPADNQRWFVNTQKAANAFNFSTKYSLKQSLIDVYCEDYK